MGLNRWGCSRLRQLAIVLNFPRISQMCQGLRRLTSWTSTSNPVVAYPSTLVRKLRTRKQHLLWNRERMSVYTINMMATKIILLVFWFFSSYLKIPKWRSNWKGWDNKFSWWHTDAKASETDVEMLGGYPDMEVVKEVCTGESLGSLACIDEIGNHGWDFAERMRRSQWWLRGTLNLRGWRREGASKMYKLIWSYSESDLMSFYKWET